MSYLPQILMLSVDFPPECRGGQGVHASQLARGLARAGCRVEVIAFHAIQGGIREEAGVRIHYLPPPAGVVAGSASMHAALGQFNKKLVEYAEALLGAGFVPDLIHCQDYILFEAAESLRWRRGIPIVGSIHLLEEPCGRWYGRPPALRTIRWEREFVRGLDTVIAVSRDIARIVEQTHEPAPQKLQVVHNGIDLDLFNNRPADSASLIKLRQSIGAQDAQIVMFAGRLSPMKGLDAFVEAAALVHAELPNTRFLVAGEASSRASHDMVTDLRGRFPALKNRLVFLGKVDHAQLIWLYRVADLVAVPSRYEPFGYVVGEAMAMGVAVVASRIGGIQEIIEDGVNGLLIPVDDDPEGAASINVAALAQAQCRLLSNRPFAAAIGRNAARHIRDHFSLEQMVARTIEVYRQCLTRQKVA